MHAQLETIFQECLHHKSELIFSWGSLYTSFDVELCWRSGPFWKLR